MYSDIAYKTKVQLALRDCSAIVAGGTLRTVIQHCEEKGITRCRAALLSLLERLRLLPTSAADDSGSREIAPPPSIDAVTGAPALDARRDLLELLLGKETYTVATGGKVKVLKLKPTLLRLMHPLVHNCLMLMWRARARKIGGVPTLRADHSGLDLLPYRPFKLHATSARGGPLEQVPQPPNTTRTPSESQHAASLDPMGRPRAGRHERYSANQALLAHDASRKRTSDRRQ